MTNDIKSKIEKIERTLKDAENEKVRAEENLKMALQRKAEIIEEMKYFNVTPDSIDIEIENLQREIAEMIKEIEENMPEA